ncbi:unnamed protein product [Diplocarpon coronariae]
MPASQDQTEVDSPEEGGAGVWISHARPASAAWCWGSRGGAARGDRCELTAPAEPLRRSTREGPNEYLLRPNERRIAEKPGPASSEWFRIPVRLRTRATHGDGPGRGTRGLICLTIVRSRPDPTDPTDPTRPSYGFLKATRAASTLGPARSDGDSAADDTLSSGGAARHSTLAILRPAASNRAGLSSNPSQDGHWSVSLRVPSSQPARNGPAAFQELSPSPLLAGQGPRASRPGGNAACPASPRLLALPATGHGGRNAPRDPEQQTTAAATLPRGLASDFLEGSVLLAAQRAAGGASKGLSGAAWQLKSAVAHALSLYTLDRVSSETSYYTVMHVVAVASASGPDSTRSLAEPMFGTRDETSTLDVGHHAGS